MILSNRSRQHGTTLIEAMIAATISALFLGSLFVMNTSSMATIKMSRDVACASQVLQQRIESLRIANWHQITDAAWLRDNVLNVDAAGAGQLKDASETITLIPYGSSTSGNTKLTRAGGLAKIESQNNALLTENALKVIWAVTYTGTPNNRSTTRQTVAILAKGGVAK
jgi:Tfp pilus assembly protein PilW